MEIACCWMNKLSHYSHGKRQEWTMLSMPLMEGELMLMKTIIHFGHISYRRADDLDEPRHELSHLDEESPLAKKVSPIAHGCENIEQLGLMFG